MDTTDEYASRLRDLSNDELLRLLAEGESSFREDCYKLLLIETKRRQLKVNGSRIDQIKEYVRTEQDMRLAKFGYALAFLGGLAGIAIGIYILKKKVKNEEGKKILRYDKELRKHGTKILIIGTSMAFIGWPLIGFILRFLLLMLQSI